MHNSMKRVGILFFLTLTVVFVYAQNINEARRIIQTLASEQMAGRGYVNDGEKQAAEFIKEAFRKLGVQPLTDSYYQKFTIPVNTIIGKTTVAVDGKALTEGFDYFIASRCQGKDTVFDLVWLDYKVASKEKRMERFMKRDLTGKIVVLDPLITASKEEAVRKVYGRFYYGNTSLAAGLITFMDKPGWFVVDAGNVTDYLALTLKKGCITKKSKQLRVSFANHFIESYTARNVIGFIPGSENPDQYIAFSAHFDHLGMMGETIIPGAHDNASGVAMIIDLARHFMENPPPFSVVFMAFSAEERGLFGSRKFVDDPLIPLDQISFLLNLDMVGTGREGITVVNGSQFPEAFNLLDSINTADSLLPQVKKRGESKNSDHYPFYEKGVKSFFIYTMDSEYSDYHNPDDRYDRLPLTGYDGLFQLVVRFANTIYSG